MKVTISPSLLSANIYNLEKDFEIFNEKGVEVIHIDLMDGHYVPNITFGIYQIEALRKLTKAEFDVHLMVTDPDMFIMPLFDAGVNAITVHAESSLHMYKTLVTIKELGMKTGVALNPATSLGALEHVFHLLDRVLIMSVEPGFGGQFFLHNSLDKIAKLNKIKQENNYDFTIQVDGGITADNIEEVIKVGAKDIVIGSSLFKGDLSENINKFWKIIEKLEI